MSEVESVASRETKLDDGNDGAAQVRLWLDAIAIASKQEEAWRKRAEETIKVYRAGAASESDSRNRDRTFNVLHANIETTVPALYNSVPVPDVRRRYADDDPVGNEVCDLIERCISYSVDSYDFDCTMRSAVKDMELAGRGVTRVRYVPYVEGDEVSYEEANCEHVQWKQFRVGPGKTWEDVPWIAFELFMTRQQLRKLSPDGNKINLDCEAEGQRDRNDGSNPPEIYKRAKVWEIWDKESREVIFIAESFKERPIRVERNPLGLVDFFPVPRPLYAIETSDSLIPVIPYDVYRDQAEELEEVSRRIMGLVEALKARGVYDGRLTEMARLSEASDNELIPIENSINYAESGLEKAIAWWPIETIAAVLEKLYVQRDQIKAAIYEITGISDILRGESDAAETATAQQIKSQWGSLRIQRKQQEVQRYARDLFRLKAEIISGKFSWETIQIMTGLQYPSQEQKQQAQMMARQAQQAQQQIPPQLQKAIAQPSREEVESLIRNDALRGFRIDVESDSTIRSDMTRNQTMMTQFLQGVGEFARSVGPGVSEGMIPADIAVEILSAFARNFRLGKQAEDALDRYADIAKQQAANPQPKPDPKAEAEKAKAQAEQQKLTMELQAKQQETQMRLQMMQAEYQMKVAELDLKKQELALKQQEMGLKAEMQQQEIAMKQEQRMQDMQMRGQQMAMESDAMHRQHQMGQEADERKHEMGLEIMAAKAKQAKMGANRPRASR